MFKRVFWVFVSECQYEQLFCNFFRFKPWKTLIGKKRRKKEAALLEQAQSSKHVCLFSERKKKRASALLIFFDTTKIRNKKWHCYWHQAQYRTLSVCANRMEAKERFEVWISLVVNFSQETHFSFSRIEADLIMLLGHYVSRLHLLCASNLKDFPKVFCMFSEKSSYFLHLTYSAWCTNKLQNQMKLCNLFLWQNWWRFRSCGGGETTSFEQKQCLWKWKGANISQTTAIRKPIIRDMI